jgi:lipopolysaccharide export system permease protein
MLTIIDRQLIGNYLKGYMVCLVSLLALYIVVDLFTNLDDFSHHSGGIGMTARLIGLYYGYKVWQIFDRLCEAILVLAATFTVAWMRRNNEQIPLLACGVSTQRIVRPVLFSACIMLTLNVVNQEMIIPNIGIKLMFQRDDPDGEKETQVRGVYEPNLIHIEGEKASRKGMIIRRFRCMIPPEVIGSLVHLTAAEARYVPKVEGVSRTGGWELTGTVATPEEVDIPEKNQTLELIDKGKYFLHVKRVDFEALTRHQSSYLLSSTWQLYKELQTNETGRQGASVLDRKKAVLFHTRLTRPLLSIVLVLLSLSVILGDQNRNIYISVGMCLVVSTAVFVTTATFKFLGDNNLISPALAAWAPLLIFGPIAIVKFDAVHT